MSEKEIYEPEKEYQSRFKDEHHENAVKLFEDLTNESGIDVEENKATCNKYRATLKEKAKYEKKLSSQKGLRIFTIVLIVLAVIAAIVGILIVSQYTLPGVLMIVLGFLAIIGLILINILVLKPRIKKIQNKVKELSEKAKQLLNEAYAQMAPLNALFDSEDSVKLFSKTVPLIKMDRSFTNERFEMLKEKYGYEGIGNQDQSILGVQSGTILGNPFVIVKEKEMDMVPHVYKGTLRIVWTTTTGSGSNRRTVTHSQVLEAEVTEPRPEYSDTTSLIYGNDAADRLSFSRMPSKINTMDDKEREKYVKKHGKDLEKLASKAMKKGGNYTPLGNEEFELFFGGLDRDEEVQFRLLFTALAQKSMLNLMKSKVGYGDDFMMIKKKKINLVSSLHSQDINLFPSEEYFMDFDYEACKERFIKYQDAFFKSVYFDFAPLLCVPLYQQTKSKEYIYQNSVKSNMNEVIHEVIANGFKTGYFSHDDTDTETILKTRVAGVSKEMDILEVTAHSFKAIEHVTYVSKMGRDGMFHQVPVHWYEYVPLEKQSVIQSVDFGLSTRELNKKKSDDAVNNLFMENGRNNGMMINRGLCSVAINSSDVNIDIASLKEKMKK